MKKTLSIVLSFCFVVSLFTCISGLSVYAIDNTPELKAVTEKIEATESYETEAAECEEEKAKEQEQAEVIKKQTKAAAPTTITTTAEKKSAATSGTCGDNATWSYNTSTKVLTITGTGAIYGYYYTEGNTTAPWKDYHDTMTTVKIGNGITRVGSFAFYQCTGIETVTLPNSITSIGCLTFYNDYKLNSINLPDNITDIESYTFIGCKALTKLVLPNKLKSIQDRQFMNCTGLEEIVIKSNVTQIGVEAFNNCSSLKEITLPSSIKTIGDNAFINCTGLEKVNFTGTITEWNNIGLGTYRSNPVTYAHNLYINNELLTDLVIPDGVTSIGRNIFNRCYSIKSITLPSSLKTINRGGFSFCTGITSITIPNGVTNISEYAFESCENLKDVIIPNSVTTIGECAFVGCKELINITLPENVTYIGGAAFRDCVNLKSIYLPSTLETIRYEAFKNCTSLKSITIPNSVTGIGRDVFLDCNKLKTIIILTKDTELSTNIFPEDATIYCYKGSTAENYAKDNLIEYKYIEYYYEDIININTKYIILNDQLIIIGTGAMDNYKTQMSVPWYDKRDSIIEIKIDNEISKIGTYAFYCLNNLESIVCENKDLEFGKYSIDKSNDITVYARKGGKVEEYCTNNNINYMDSTPIPATPSAPDYESHSDNSITLKANEKYEYRLNEGNWQKSNVFTNLSKNTIYRFYQRVAETDNEYASGSSPALITAIPDKPVILAASYDSIMVKPVNGFEYCLDDMAWQSDKSFDMLIDDMEYYVYQRIAATDGEKVYQITSDYTVITTDNSITHEHKYTSVITKEASCTEKGEKLFTCTECLETKTEEIKMLTHNYTNWVTTKSPTCTEKGEEERVCSVCNHKETRDIEALGHDYKAVITEPTCTEQGYTTHICSRCNDSYKDNYTDALGHKPGEITIENSVSATCETAGSYDEVIYCTVCKTELSRETKNIPALGHDWQTEWSNDSTHHWHTCTRCDEVNEKAEHTFGEWIKTKPATGNEMGERKHICSVCGYEESEEFYIPGNICGDDEKITDKDATYLLFHLFFPEEYEVNQPLDFNGDGKEDVKDVIYLLFYIYFPKYYKLH